jgi:hypothetical protein
MLPTSDELESFHVRVKQLASDLRRLGSAEANPEIKAGAAEIARTWLRLSPSIHDAGICVDEELRRFDDDMKALLTSCSARARGSSLLKKIAAFESKAVNSIVVPLIKHEGSPRQVAARQIQSAFSNILTADEANYVEEASRCVTVQSNRAAIIMLWAAAIARIHAGVIKKGFDAYNQAVERTIAKKGPPFNRIKESAKISSLPELQKSRDADLLLIGMELFSYDLQVFQELDRLLGIRNDAAHPGMAQVSALDVQQYGAKLANLVFAHVAI